MPHFLIPGNVHFKENNNFCCQEKLRELVTEPLSPHCFRLCRGSFQQHRAARAAWGSTLGFLRTSQRITKTFKKRGGFFCNKDIFLKQYRGLVSWAWNLWQFFLHQDVHHLLVAFSRFRCRNAHRKLPPRLADRRGSRVEETSHRQPQAECWRWVEMMTCTASGNIWKMIFRYWKNKEKNHTKFV